MPKKIIITKLGGPEVLNYVDYNVYDNILDNNVRIKQTAIGLNYISNPLMESLYKKNNFHLQLS